MNITGHSRNQWHKRPDLSAVAESSTATKSTTYKIYRSSDDKLITSIKVDYHTLTPAQEQELITKLSLLTHTDLQLKPTTSINLNIYS